ncbi:MAG: NAD(P)-dependent oxidoreductase [Ruminococcaceae bacterium]|nr:NAD(P)-dependent oxidoreductase [Oscillospiraceae bacterium]
MKAVISGATGAIGMALIRTLVERGDSVLVLCRGDSPRGDRIPTHPLVTKAVCGLSDMKAFAPTAGKTYDVFFHFAWAGTTGAARNDMPLQNDNVRYTLDAVDLAERMGCHTFVGAGSQAEYGRVEGRLSAETPAFPENGYGMAKLCAGQMSRVMCEAKGLRHLWARILSVYGPYDGVGSMVMSTLKKLKEGEKPSFTAGEQIWDYLYCDDAAAALIAMAERGVHGKVYCLGSGDPRPLKDYITAIRDAAAPGAALGLGEVPYSDKQVMYLCADITELTADTGFVPKVSFDEGIAKTVAWYNEVNR